MSPSNCTRPLVPGVYVPTVAFFHGPTEEVDVEAVEKHATFLSKSGIAGIVVQGSNGEAVHLDREERQLITKATRRALDAAGAATMPVIVGAGAASTRESIQLCQDAATAGGDCVLVLPPGYYKTLLNNEALLGFFREIADASPLPLIIYNYPGAANGVDLSSDEIIALAAHPNIAGVKLTCGNTGKLARVVAGSKSNFITLGGSCDFTLQTLIVGGHGVIAGTANILPRSCVRIMELYQAGQIEEAQKVQAIVARADWVAIKGGFVAVKSALQSYYGYGALPRRPCLVPSSADVAALKQAFAEGIALENSLVK
jgi:4-hydroxy-2-oxoglutarate aldolase